MSGFYDTCELRLVQDRQTVTAADATTAQLGPVPAGKIWNIIATAYIPSVNETQLVWMEKVSAAGRNYALINPQSIALNPGILTTLEFGMELQLLPGEYMRARRAAFTAGSTMQFQIQYVETDMPLYEYIEPQLQKRIRMAATSIKAAVSRGAGGGGGGGGGPSGFRGGRGTPPAR